MRMHTLAAACRHEIDVRKSRFLAQAAPVGDADAALAWIASVSDAGATHNCWAFRIGQQYRSSDDGEPAGTAGRPILAAIDGQGMDRTAVVVTRWYGGIKLGAGGLVRAYGGAAAECLRLAPRVEIVPMRSMRLSCDFAFEATARGLVEQAGGRVVDPQYDARGLVLAIDVPESAVASLALRLRDASRGQAGLA